jgi:hypothetical protein
VIAPDFICRLVFLGASFAWFAVALFLPMLANAFFTSRIADILSAL